MHLGEEANASLHRERSAMLRCLRTTQTIRRSYMRQGTVSRTPANCLGAPWLRSRVGAFSSDNSGDMPSNVSYSATQIKVMKKCKELHSSIMPLNEKVRCWQPSRSTLTHRAKLSHTPCFASRYVGLWLLNRIAERRYRLSCWSAIIHPESRPLSTMSLAAKSRLLALRRQMMVRACTVDDMLLSWISSHFFTCQPLRSLLRDQSIVIKTALP